MAARDAESASSVAASFTKLGVPIHVVPLGSITRGGDAAIVSLVVPDAIRKQSQVSIQAFVRSYGYDGINATVELLSIDPGAPARKLASTPVALRDGFQSVTLTFRSDESPHKIRARVVPLPDEIAVDNNTFDVDLMMERTKIRVLYVEGNVEGLRAELRGTRVVQLGAFSVLQEALEQDADIECRAVLAAGDQLTAVEGSTGGFPRSPAELSSFDAIILSNAPRRLFSDEQLRWIEDWVEKRGAGLCMVGGPASFGEGGWRNTPVEKVLPLYAPDGPTWSNARPMDMRPLASDQPHPIFQLLEDRRRNRALLESIPQIQGAHAGLIARANFADVLAVNAAQSDVAVSSDSATAIVAGRFGRGRTMAMTFPITSPAADKFLAWGQGDNQFYARFWRNVVYWLSENSFIGRSRLVATVDKQFYEPGETVTLSATAYDDSAGDTTAYRLMALVEPQSLDVESDYAPLRWPSGVERISGAEGPLVMWGEEFEIPVRKAPDGRSAYSLPLELAEGAATNQTSGGLKLELTAYDEDAQVDSASLSIQVLNDPFEQQNPFPNHALLKQLAAESGGSVIESSDQLAELFRKAPVVVGRAQRHASPVWSRWWLLLTLLALFTGDWLWRRRIGMA